MALTERTRDYETLIRYNDDGTIGASHATIYEVLDDTGVISARINAPEQLDVAASGDAALTAVLGTALIASDTEKVALQARVVSLQATVDTLTAQVATLTTSAQADAENV